MLLSFIRLVTYLFKFIPKVATVLKTLYDLLLEESKCIWSEYCESAFCRSTINEELVKTSNFSFILTLDIQLCSSVMLICISGVLLLIINGKEFSIAFVSRTVP